MGQSSRLSQSSPRSVILAPLSLRCISLSLARLQVLVAVRAGILLLETQYLTALVRVEATETNKKMKCGCAVVMR